MKQPEDVPLSPHVVAARMRAIQRGEALGVDDLAERLDARGALPFVHAIARSHGVTFAELAHWASGDAARSEAMSVLRRQFSLSFPELAQLFGVSTSSARRSVLKAGRR